MIRNARRAKNRPRLMRRSRKRGEQLAADQITTKDKEQIDTDPAEAVHAPGQFESEKCGVIDDHHDNRKRAKKIEAGLAFAISKARINCGFARLNRPNAHQSYFGDWAESFRYLRQ